MNTAPLQLVDATPAGRACAYVAVLAHYEADGTEHILAEGRSRGLPLRLFHDRMKRLARQAGVPWTLVVFRESGKRTQKWRGSHYWRCMQGRGSRCRVRRAS